MRRPACLLTAMVVLFLFGILLAPQFAVGQSAVVIKLATLAPEGSPWVQELKAAAEEAQQKTGNAIQFKIYPGGVMGDERDMVRKMHIGQLQAAMLSSSSLASMFSEIDVLQIPFLFDSYPQADFVVGKMEDGFKSGLEKNGYVALGWSEAGFVYLMSTVPVETLELLRKAKVWIWNDSPMAKAIFEEAGVIGVPLSITDVLVGLQTGLVEVVYAPPSVAVALQWFTRIKYITDAPLNYMLGGLVAKKEAFDKIAPQHQTVIKEVFQRHMSRLKEAIRAENQEALTVMQKQGVRLVTPGKAQIADYKGISEKAMQRENSHKYSPKTKEEVSAWLKAYAEGRK
ncbi:MAG TPA: TRAP transporter substrate-binding protein DctP [Desulfobacterales bacterium]|nr:TRAP transporter substrate-binding protein DctP [Desulfobacterales bacterium]